MSIDIRGNETRTTEDIDAEAKEVAHTEYDLQNRVIGTWGADYPVVYENEAP